MCVCVAHILTMITPEEPSYYCPSCPNAEVELTLVKCNKCLTDFDLYTRCTVCYDTRVDACNCDFEVGQRQEQESNHLPPPSPPLPLPQSSRLPIIRRHSSPEEILGYISALKVARDLGEPIPISPMELDKCLAFIMNNSLHLDEVPVRENNA